MNSCLVRVRLDELRVLDEHALEITFADTGNASWSICFWFLVEALKGKQVIANQGCIDDAEPGWSVYLEEDGLHIRFCLGEAHVTDLVLPGLVAGTWMHFAMVVDRPGSKLSTYLYGAGDAPREMRQRLMPLSGGAVVFGEKLLLGGYTDAAGGHFDYTFGRDGSGLLDDVRIYRRGLTSEEIASLVDPENKPPTAIFEVDGVLDAAPTSVQFDAGKSVDSDGIIESYLWEFGDGTKGYGVAPVHHFACAGDYHVRMTAIDDDHGQATVARQLVLRGRANPLRVTPVFANGQEGYACYRIPGIVRTVTGALLAFAEGRVESCSDSTRTVHIVCKRSTDNGLTWGPLQVVARNERTGDVSAVQNCSPVVDMMLGTGRVVVLFNKAEYSEWDLANGIGTSRCCRIISDDHGLTWQNEIDITSSVHRPLILDRTATEDLSPALPQPEWRIQRPTLGHAIQLRHESVKGRLFYAGVFTAGDRSVFESQNYAFWSDDLGETWTIGGIVPQIGLNEATAVELETGGVMINSRAYLDRQSVGRRAVTIGTFDEQGHIAFGRTRFDPALVDPAVQASVMRYTWSNDVSHGGAGRILFSNPNHARARRNMTVRMSCDDGRTWPFSRTIDPGPSSYSDLVIQEDMDIGLLYERGNQGGIFYASFPLEWLSDGQVIA
jgi:hypothetical protein